MDKITLELKLEMLIPTLQVYKKYFNEKYSCTNENNDGSGMPIEDAAKFIIYNYLLSTYEKYEDISIEAYNEFQNLIK